MPSQLSLDLFVPDRFEPLRERAAQQLGTIIEPVEAALVHLDHLHQDLVSAGRGGFLVLRGASGTGKSTFLHTVDLFREGVEALSIPPVSSVQDALRVVGPSKSKFRLIVIEEREALKDVSSEELERDLHSINGFLRSRNGMNTLVVWPCNTDALRERLISLAKDIGASALLGGSESAYTFIGPSREQFRKIAENTVATLNQGATLADLGVAEEEMQSLIANADTVGTLLGRLRATINSKKSGVTTLLKKEHCKLWIVVAAANEPDRDVDALTRGRYSAIDIERLLTATEANIVKELKTYPDKLGILATVLDAKVFHLPMLAALDIIRTYADTSLREKMKRVALSDKASASAKPLERLAKTDLGRMFEAGSKGTMAPGGKAGSNTQEAFKKLVAIAQSDDAALNRALAVALKDAGYIQSFDLEKDFGTGLSRCTDIFCRVEGGIIRVELMWRARVGRADIANYALTKLYNYGRAIGFLPDR